MKLKILIFSVRNDSKLKISVKNDTVWVLMGINEYSCETKNFNFPANDSILKFSVQIGTPCGYQWESMGIHVKLKISIFLPEKIIY